LRATPLFRVDVAPSQENGLRRPSQIMVDKIQTIPLEKAGMVIGRVDDAVIMAVTRALAMWLGFA